MKHKMQKNSVKTRSVYRGHTSGINEKIIVATNPNEAYALMLDALAGKTYEKNEVFADPETNRYINAYFKRYPVGAYDPLPAKEYINHLKVV